ncbi:MAG TPA: sigma-70 family RNA polymerase sigma factor [Planctomycetaceae bacterium]|nr:sigma-70 family RNA polymerase sigma factor [Planctomycetaceae bacterium]
MSDLPASTDDWADRLRSGDRTALAELCHAQRERLRLIVRDRLNRRLGGRLDDDDVLQEIYLQAEARLMHFTGASDEEAVGWLILVAKQTVIDIHRRHFAAQVRDLRRELRPADVAHSASQPSAWLFGSAGLTSPSQIVARDERQRWLHGILDRLPENDREIILLRHFVECSNTEAAEVLGLTAQAASIRYVRAISRLRDLCGPLLDKAPGLFSSTT